MKPLVLLLVALSFTLVTSQCPRCGPICDCSRLNLTEVPTAPSQLISHLDLSFNGIRQVLNGDFAAFASLRFLILNNNEIETIQEDALAPLTQLEGLDLSHNKLETLFPCWFGKLTSLQYLNLLGNHYTTLGEGNLFQALKTLRVLHVGGASLRSVRRGNFPFLSGVDELLFDGRNLEVYEDGSLKALGPISHVTLDLSGGFARNRPMVHSVLSDVVCPNTTLTFTNTVLLLANQMSPFGVAANLGVKGIILRNNIMSIAALVEIVNRLSHSNLTLLAVDGGRLVQSHQHPPLYELHMPRLEVLFLNNVQAEWFYGMPLLGILSRLMTTARHASLLNSNWFAIPCQISSIFKMLQFLDISGNIFSDLTLSELMCYGRGQLSSLQTLNISRNFLRTINSQLFTRLPQLQNIDMSGNMFHDMPETCHWPENLRFLNLSSSQLTEATRCLPPSLRVLDLSNNQLTWFYIELPFLTHLYISGNKIRNLPDGNLYPGLAFLSIQDNALQGFSSEDLHAYQKLRKLEAGDNPYFCSCDFVAFMTSDPVNHREALSRKLDSYICNSPDAERGRPVSGVRLSVFECHTVVAFTVLCFIFLVLCLLVAVLCHQLGVVWYIRMTWAWLRAKRKPKLKKGAPQYDAFVSYSDMDSGWVETHLVPELEQSDPPVRLCLHKRDFLPGGWILDNIMDAIEKSHRTLFVLSRHFLKSEWCKYELDYSHFRLFDQNDDAVVLVLLEAIDNKTIPKRFCRLRRAMNSRTYLEWPADDGHIPAFWRSLRAAIK